MVETPLASIVHHFLPIKLPPANSYRGPSFYLFSKDTIILASLMERSPAHHHLSHQNRMDLLILRKIPIPNLHLVRFLLSILNIYLGRDKTNFSLVGSSRHLIRGVRAKSLVYLHLMKFGIIWWQHSLDFQSSHYAALSSAALIQKGCWHHG